MTAFKQPTSGEELARVEDLRVHFRVRTGQLRRQKGLIRAVDGVSFSLQPGEAVALVGPPRCGKTTVARTLALLERPTAGRVFFQGRDLTPWRGRHFGHARRGIQMLFSNPYRAFAPRTPVEEILTEALDLSKRQSGQGQARRAAELMTQVGLNHYLAVRFPRELSGGNRQRLAIARALATEPLLLICDQPTEHIDPAAGEGILDLLSRLRRQLGLTMVLTARRLDAAGHVDRVAIMLQGRVVEMGYAADLVRQPLHPFTRALLEPQSSGFVPSRDLAPLRDFVPLRDLVAHVGRTLDPSRPASGCHYAPLCPLVEAQCRAHYPRLREVTPRHGVACHLAENV